MHLATKKITELPVIVIGNEEAAQGGATYILI